VFPVTFRGEVVDYYLVKIFIPPHYPKSVPTVWEIGGRIPRDVDWHVNNYGALCLFMPAERWKYWPKGSTFLDFLKKPVNDFFLSTTYRFQTGEYPFGERPHGRDGVIQYFVEELGTEDEEIILTCLEYLSRKEPKGHWPCYCGSGKKMRECHFDEITKLHDRIDPEIAGQLVEYLRKTSWELFRSKWSLMFGNGLPPPVLHA
jgi:hypothetical protein